MGELDKGGASEPEKALISIAEGARVLGLDSFTVFRLIQRGRVSPARAPSGEMVLPESELARLSERSGPA